MVRGPAHGPQVDVVKLAATPWAPVLVALSIFEELALAVPYSSRDGSSRDERQPVREFPQFWTGLKLVCIQMVWTNFQVSFSSFNLQI